MSCVLRPVKQIVQVSSGVLGGVPNPALCAGAYSVTVASLPPGLQLPPHAHERATLNVVLDGPYEETVGRRSLGTHGPATLISKPAGAVHENRVSEPVECLVIEVDASDVVDDVVIQRSARVAHCAGRLRAELVRADDVTTVAVEELVLGLLAEGRPGPEGNNRSIARARDLLHDEPAPQSLSELADRLGLHPVYLARAFRARYGCSVGEYVRCLRLERARRLLHHSRLDLGAIAAEAGYSDQSHMTRDFRRMFDHSPGAYRRLARQVP